MEAGSIISDGALVIRRMVADQADLAIMAAWLSDQRVLEFYEGRDRPHDTAMVRRHFIEETQAKGETPCIVEFDGRAIGYIQFYRVVGQDLLNCGFTADDPVYGIDQFIGDPELWGQGFGQRIIRLMLRRLFDVERAGRVIVDPVIGNARAVHCYEACGFRRVTLLPSHEMHEGKYHDCWLMETTPNEAGIGGGVQLP